MVAARVNLESSTRTRRFRTGQKKYLRRVLKCLDSMLLRTSSRLNPRGRHIFEFGVCHCTSAICCQKLPRVNPNVTSSVNLFLIILTSTIFVSTFYVSLRYVVKQINLIGTELNLQTTHPSQLAE